MSMKTIITSLCLVGTATLLGRAAPISEAQRSSQWLESFNVNLSELATTGENPYFPLLPGYKLTLEGKEGGKTVQLVFAVLNETKNVGGVETRIVEERESKAGVPVEVSRNFFAIHPQTKDVFYFGEDVDMYKNGKISGHEGSWQHGSNGARFGLMMPGKPTVGIRFYQEHAPKVAMDRAEIVSLTERVTTPAGAFDSCLKTKETTPLEMFARESKFYAPGVGLIRDGSLTLVSREPARKAP